MERLTKKELCDYTTMDFHSIQMDWHSIYNKLAEFEDFMEEVGAESLAEIETCIVDLNKENQTLKGNWAKLREFMKSEHDWGLENDYQDCSYGIRLVLDKMQELESADGKL